MINLNVVFSKLKLKDIFITKNSKIVNRKGYDANMILNFLRWFFSNIIYFLFLTIPFIQYMNLKYM